MKVFYFILDLIFRWLADLDLKKGICLIIILFSFYILAETIDRLK